MSNKLSFRYDFEGNFLDKEKWWEAKIAFATASELYYIVKERLTIEGSDISPNKADELISLLNRALMPKETDDNPNFKARIYEMLGEVYETQNEIEHAIGNYTWALSLSSENEASIYRKLGEIYESQYEIEQAIKHYEIALHCNPKVGVKKKLEKLRLYRRLDY
jgi:tetratricopeptide (TPR) repeat protein